MKTLTVTEARKNLSAWLRRAKAGEEIGIVEGAQVFAIRPVAVLAADYALHEYGASDAEVAAAVARARDEIAAERAGGSLTEVFAHAHPANQTRRRTGRRALRKRPH